jgi:hypothetical protein
MKNKQIDLPEYIENHIIDCDISYRGGTLKVDVSGLFSQDSIDAVEEAGETLEAGAYQNYLGGGMAGSIQSGRSFDASLLTKEDQELYKLFSEAVKRHFYNINNGGGDEYMQDCVTGHDAVGGYEKLQKLPVSGY